MALSYNYKELLLGDDLSFPTQLVTVPNIRVEVNYEYDEYTDSNLYSILLYEGLGTVSETGESLIFSAAYSDIDTGQVFYSIQPYLQVVVDKDNAVLLLYLDSVNALEGG